jgi:hypothetical protein|tara:strand:+ start:56 stop:703 length:648 start_codon:yes stop_codon:yes gene_type:complete
MSLSPTTELEAINTMLTSIGEQPIQNKDDLAGLTDASIAEQILNNVSRAVQSRGWIFNTDLDQVMKPNDKGIIPLDDKILRIDTTSNLRNSTTDIVERGRQLYDRKRNTPVFEDDAEVKVDVIRLLNFTDLPEPARRYITIRAARIFHDRVVGSSELHTFYQQDELQAWSVLIEYEGDVSDYNIFDNYDVYRVVDRLPGISSSRLGYNVIDSYTT